MSSAVSPIINTALNQAMSNAKLTGVEQYYCVVTDAAKLKQIQEFIDQVQLCMRHAIYDAVNGLAEEGGRAANFNKYYADPDEMASLSDGRMKVFPMKLGYAIEKETYSYLRFQAKLLGFNFIEETKGSNGTDFPGSFIAIKDGGKDSRPDLRLALGGGDEAAFDLTSKLDAKKTHTSARNWATVASVKYIAEIWYDITEY